MKKVILKMKQIFREIRFSNLSSCSNQLFFALETLELSLICLFPADATKTFMFHLSMTLKNFSNMVLVSCIQYMVSCIQVLVRTKYKFFSVRLITACSAYFHNYTQKP